MKTLKSLFERNRAWAEEISAREPGFFRELARQQTPEYLWIGCSDSRVPSTQLVALSPGEVRAAARREGHDDAHRLGRIALSDDECREKQTGDEKQFPDHSNSSSTVKRRGIIFCL
jgi:hypothetical protein